MLAMTNVRNGPDRSEKQPIYSRAGALLPPQTSNPKGNLPLMREVSPQVTEGEKSYPVKSSR